MGTTPYLQETTQKHLEYALSTCTEFEEKDMATQSDFALRHPLKRIRTVIDNQTVDRMASLYHEFYTVQKQLALADDRISLGSLSHLSDNEDICPYLSTFREAYRESALEWMIGQLSFVNWRIGVTNPMDERQMRICSIAIFNAFPYLNLAEILRFFGRITTYHIPKDSYIFGESQVMSALRLFDKDRRSVLETYDRMLRDTKLKKEKELWRKTGITFQEWKNTPEGKEFCNEMGPDLEQIKKKLFNDDYVK